MDPPGRRDQADSLCDELHRHIDALDAKAAKLKAQIAKYVAERRPLQITRVQAEARSVAVERRKLITMLIDLGHNYPCDHGSVH